MKWEPCTLSMYDPNILCLLVWVTKADVCITAQLQPKRYFPIAYTMLSTGWFHVCDLIEFNKGFLGYHISGYCSAIIFLSLIFSLKWHISLNKLSWPFLIISFPISELFSSMFFSAFYLYWAVQGLAYSRWSINLSQLNG